jgi:hypothetical protein
MHPKVRSITNRAPLNFKDWPVITLPGVPTQEDG